MCAPDVGCIKPGAASGAQISALSERMGRDATLGIAMAGVLLVVVIIALIVAVYYRRRFQKLKAIVEPPVEYTPEPSPMEQINNPMYDAAPPSTSAPVNPYLHGAVGGSLSLNGSLPRPHNQQILEKKAKLDSMEAPSNGHATAVANDYEIAQPRRPRIYRKPTKNNNDPTCEGLVPSSPEKQPLIPKAGPLPAIPQADMCSEAWGEGVEDSDSIYECIDEMERPGPNAARTSEMEDPYEAPLISSTLSSSEENLPE